ncbi:skin secretory protein xP2-like [Vulpes lagopus]|uniref:skin secretory protein xP2-like n=1 Tax=Vulpes lagopus TaxID=494514 RepID=UPI001BC91622|nr:skin secretory protein xP2-like [Vulpes lagopus]
MRARGGRCPGVRRAGAQGPGPESGSCSGSATGPECGGGIRVAGTRRAGLAPAAAPGCRGYVTPRPFWVGAARGGACGTRGRAPGPGPRPDPASGRPPAPALGSAHPSRPRRTKPVPEADGQAELLSTDPPRLPRTGRRRKYLGSNSFHS